MVFTTAENFSWSASFLHDSNKSGNNSEIRSSQCEERDEDIHQAVSLMNLRIQKWDLHKDRSEYKSRIVVYQSIITLRIRSLKISQRCLRNEPNIMLWCSNSRAKTFAFRSWLVSSFKICCLAILFAGSKAYLWYHYFCLGKKYEQGFKSNNKLTYTRLHSSKTFSSSSLSSKA